MRGGLIGVDGFLRLGLGLWIGMVDGRFYGGGGVGRGGMRERGVVGDRIKVCKPLEGEDTATNLICGTL